MPVVSWQIVPLSHIAYVDTWIKGQFLATLRASLVILKKHTVTEEQFYNLKNMLIYLQGIIP